MKQLSTNLKILMAYRGISVGELANTSKITKPTIYFILQGKHFPHGGTITKIAETLKVGPADLFRTDLINLGDSNGREGQR